MEEREGDAAEAVPQSEKKDVPEQVFSSKSLKNPFFTIVKKATAAVQRGLCWTRYSNSGGSHTGTGRCALKEAADHGELTWSLRYWNLWRTCAKAAYFWWTMEKTHTGAVYEGLYPMGLTPQCSRQRLWERWTAAAKINFYELAANQIPHPPAPFGTKEVEDTGVKFSLGRRRGGGNMCLFLSFASRQPSLVLIGNKLDQSPHSLVFSLTQSFLSSFSPCPAEEKERPLGG